jgi:deoxyribonuclease V
MKIQSLHAWNLGPKEAVALQREFADRVVRRGLRQRFRLVAGADVSYARFSKTLYAGVVVLQMPELHVVESQSVVCEASFPYVPGLLSFREAPAVLEAFGRLRSEPDVVILDGQGFAHPRRFGLACHLGLWLDRATIGCAKSLLIGEYNDLGDEVGAQAALKDKGEVIGTALRTRSRCKPVFVSVGHRIGLPSAVGVILSTCRGYRLPEPTRQAHLLVNSLRVRAACSGSMSHL